MSFVPINGLRCLAIEIGLLGAFTALLLFVFRYFPLPLRQPEWLRKVLAKNWRAVLLVIAIALMGRVALLPWVGIPQPHINDEYSYLLMGDTFAHWRLSNPTPPAWQHFETFHVNLVPTYHSKYPVSQGLALAAGEIVFHQPWVGIYIATALLCGAICWALQAFVPPVWALLGGLLAVVRLALLSYWVNSYWGGSLAALGGALALGSVMRLFAIDEGEGKRAWTAAIFALSLLLLATSRPFEGLAFSLPLLAYFCYKLGRGWLRHDLGLAATATPLLVIGVAGLALMAHYNRRTTGSPLLMPYALNERTYSQLPLFFGQPMPHNVEEHDPVFDRYYVVEAQEHDYQAGKSASQLLSLQLGRLASNWFFYVGPALSFPLLIGLLMCVKQKRLWLVFAATVTTGAAVALCLFSQAHYFSPATVAVYLFVLLGLHNLWEEGTNGARAFVIAVCLTVTVASLSRNSGASAINQRYSFPNTRELVADRLRTQPGKQLVVVTYDTQRHYPGDELVHNGADFSSEKILWARAKGEGSDSDLCSAYADRTFWSVTTDDVSYSLKPLDLCHQQSSARR